MTTCTPKEKLNVSDVVKLFTNVPSKFVDDFFELYRPDTKQYEFVINIDSVAKWLDVEKFTLNSTLKKSYKVGIDYTVERVARDGAIKSGSNNYIKVMLTPDCMKRMCMRSRSKKAETVRTYFIEIESFIIKYNSQIVDGIVRDIKKTEAFHKQHPLKEGPGYIYIIRAAAAHSNLYKLGHTQDLYKRLSTYNTGRSTDVELLYAYHVQRRKEVESCVKVMMKDKQYKKRREIYHVDIDIIKKVIDGCSSLSDAKLHHKTAKSRLDGEYYMVFSVADSH
jgi:phage anti-repressor protein